jgi:hypothetical protein
MRLDFDICIFILEYNILVLTRNRKLVENILIFKCLSFFLLNNIYSSNILLKSEVLEVYYLLFSNLYGYKRIRCCSCLYHSRNN